MRRALAATLAMLALLVVPMVAKADTFLPVVLHQDKSGPVVPTATEWATATASPTATATATATSTATATTTATTEPSPTPTATPHWVQLITDGGFELGTASPWLQSSTGGYQLIRYGIGNTAGHFAAALCGYNGGRDAIAQFVTIPANTIQGGTAFAWSMVTLDNPAIAKDFLSLWLLDASSQKLVQIGGVDNRYANGQWMVQTSADLAPYRGLTVAVHFECTNDLTFSTEWYVDDVSFLVQVP